MIDPLINKYNVPGPRYTSYPTVPFWDASTFTENAYLQTLKTTFNHTNKLGGISLYIHLPYCESLCTFCGCNKRITKNHEVETPYIEAVLKEWEIYLSLFDEKPCIAELHFGGGTPSFFQPQNLEKLISGILKNAKLAEKLNLVLKAIPTILQLNTCKHYIIWASEG